MHASIRHLKWLIGMKKPALQGVKHKDTGRIHSAVVRAHQFMTKLPKMIADGKQKGDAGSARIHGTIAT